jgi:hypothetical protein
MVALVPMVLAHAKETLDIFIGICLLSEKRIFTQYMTLQVFDFELPKPRKHSVVLLGAVTHIRQVLLPVKRERHLPLVLFRLDPLFNQFLQKHPDTGCFGLDFFLEKHVEFSCILSFLLFYSAHHFFLFFLG